VGIVGLGNVPAPPGGGVVLHQVTAQTFGPILTHNRWAWEHGPPGVQISPGESMATGRKRLAPRFRPAPVWGSQLPEPFPLILGPAGLSSGCRIRGAFLRTTSDHAGIDKDARAKNRRGVTPGTRRPHSTDHGGRSRPHFCGLLFQSPNPPARFRDGQSPNRASTVACRVRKSWRVKSFPGQPSRR